MSTILLIEDNIPFLENLAEYVETEGYKILIADNGKKAIELVPEHIPVETWIGQEPKGTGIGA